jgi:hypothetical protein
MWLYDGTMLVRPQHIETETVVKGEEVGAGLGGARKRGDREGGRDKGGGGRVGRGGGPVGRVMFV